jgi:Domain of unknown function (DUF4375)
MAYAAVLEPYWKKIDIYSGPDQFLATHGAAPLLQRRLFAAHLCEAEVANGGLFQFFTNATGVLAPEALEAYQHLRLADLAEVLLEAMAVFGPSYPRRQEERQARLIRIPGKPRQEWDPFVALDERFYSAAGRSPRRLFDGHRLFDAMDAYAEGGEP